MTNEYGLKEVFETELMMLKELDRVCKKLGISYMLDAGTLIGAVREHGFIPWDDDMDITMTRENFDRFLNEAPDEFSSDFIIQRPEDLAEDDRFYDYVSRLIYTPSHRRSADDQTEYFGDKLNKLWIDIFTIDNLSDNALNAFIIKSFHKLIYAFSLGHKKAQFRNATSGQQVLLIPFTFIGRMIPLSTLCRWKQYWSVRDINNKTKMKFISNYPVDWMNMTIQSEWVESTTELPFEDTMLPVPKGYDELLTAGYGNYMQRPAEKDRHPAHGIDPSEFTVEK